MFDGAPLFPVEDFGHMLADGASGVGVELGEGIPVLCLEAVQDCLEDGVGVVGEAPLGGAHRVDGTAPRVLQDAADVPQGLVRRVVSAVYFASRAGAAVRRACHSWSWWRGVVRSARRWASRSFASGVLGCSIVASSSFVVQMSCTSCWRVRSGCAAVLLVSRSMPHACAARRMAVVSVGASGRRRMACRALLYLCQAPWSSSAANCSVDGRVLSCRVAPGGGRLGIMRSM